MFPKASHCISVVGRAIENRTDYSIQRQELNLLRRVILLANKKNYKSHQRPIQDEIDGFIHELSLKYQDDPLRDTH